MKTKLQQYLSVATSFLLPFCLTISLNANIVEWDANDGDWTDPANWNPAGVPGAADEPRFTSTPGLDDAITVDLSGTHTVDALRYSTGKDVTLNMADGSSLTSGILGAGNYSGDVLGFSGLRFIGPATGSATVNLSGISAGRNHSAVSTETVFSGSNLVANITGLSTMGRAGQNNSLIVENGAFLEAATIWVADNRGDGFGNNNAAIVRGAGSVIEQTSSTIPINIAGRNSPDSLTGNHVLIEDGGRWTVTGDDPGSEAVIGIALGGSGETRIGNYIHVTGANSLFELVDNTRITIGRGQAAQRDNYVLVDDGGTITTEGEIQVRRRNQLIIGEGGTLQSSGLIDVQNGSTLRLHETGQLTGSAVVEVDSTSTSELARFEAAGNGLGANVTVNVRENAILAVGVSGATEESQLALDSNVNMFNGSVMELTIFGNNAMDSIDFGSGEINLAFDAVNLSILLGGGYEPVFGDTFQAFTGNVDIVNEFSSIGLPALDEGLEWDLSSFNDGGEWTLSVIPEPGTYALFFGLGVLALVVFRRVRR